MSLRELHRACLHVDLINILFIVVQISKEKKHFRPPPSLATLIIHGAIRIARSQYNSSTLWCEAE